MRHQLKSRTPSAAARLKYITRAGRYASGIDGRRDDLQLTANANLPDWANGDARLFWSAADGFERANARRCIELELNLPRELSTQQQAEAVVDYIERLSDVAGQMPCTWAIHDNGNGNPHVHLMLQERPLDGIERTAETWFKRANNKTPEKGGAAKSRWWHDKQNVFWSRALWADASNQALIRAGHEARFDARRKSVRLEEAFSTGDFRQVVMLSTSTEKHEGFAVAGMRRRIERGECVLDDLPEFAQQLIASNDRIRAGNCELRDFARSATEAELREYLAPVLEDRNPSSHITAWLDAMHVAAISEDNSIQKRKAQLQKEAQARASARAEAEARANAQAQAETRIQYEAWAAEIEVQRIAEIEAQWWAAEIEAQQSEIRAMRAKIEARRLEAARRDAEEGSRRALPVLLDAKRDLSIAWGCIAGQQAKDEAEERDLAEMREAIFEKLRNINQLKNDPQRNEMLAQIAQQDAFRFLGSVTSWRADADERARFYDEHDVVEPPEPAHYLDPISAGSGFDYLDMFEDSDMLEDSEHVELESPKPKSRGPRL